MEIRRRPAIWTGECVLGTIAIVAMMNNFERSGRALSLPN